MGVLEKKCVLVVNVDVKLINKNIMSELKVIKLPEGFEVDKENSTDTEIVLKESAKPFTPKTWEEIQKVHSINNKAQYFISAIGNIGNTGNDLVKYGRAHLPSRHIAEKIRALCQLHIIADFYNGDWKPTYEGVKTNRKCSVGWDNVTNCFKVYIIDILSSSMPVFKDYETAMEAYNNNKRIFETALKP